MSQYTSPDVQTPSQSFNPSFRSIPRLHTDDSHPDSATISMSGILPADDGMRALRSRMHEIHEMALSSEEKAKQMHALMVSDYRAFKIQQQQQQQQRVLVSHIGNRKIAVSSQDSELARPASPGSTSSSSGENVIFDLGSEDIEATYWPQVAKDSPMLDDGDEERDEEEPIFGCKHYMRNVKVQCSDCRRWHTCRHCHDEFEDHSLVRKKIRNMLCMYCGHAQRAGDQCQECEEQAASYYCDMCKLWDNDASKSIYHCPDCGICRKGEGLGKDYVHCKVCYHPLSRILVQGLFFKESANRTILEMQRLREHKPHL